MAATDITPLLGGLRARLQTAGKLDSDDSNDARSQQAQMSCTAHPRRVRLLGSRVGAQN